MGSIVSTCPSLLVSPPPKFSNILCSASTFCTTAGSDQKHSCFSASKCCLLYACLPVSPCRYGYWRNWQTNVINSKYWCWTNNDGQFRQAQWLLLAQLLRKNCIFDHYYYLARTFLSIDNSNSLFSCLAPCLHYSLFHPLMSLSQSFISFLFSSTNRFL